MPSATLADHLIGHAARGRRPALVLRGRYRSERWTYAELARAVDVGAAMLQRAGVSRGDRVLLRGPDSPPWTAALLACVRTGAVAVPLDAGAGDGMAARVASRAKVSAAILPAADRWDAGLPRLDLGAFRPGPPPAELPPPHRAEPGEVLEIIFTSGTTGEPRGVTITHGNVLAYVDRIEAGYRKRRWYVDPFLPLPLLCLPPLSHLFGQAVGVFLPLRLGCTVVYVEGRDPATMLHVIREERIALAMTVPRMLEMLAGRLRAEAFRRGWGLDELVRAGAGRGLAARIWAARRVQRWLGWRLRGFVVGGAPLDPDLESFWRGLGYLVVQGYGLTETAPVVTLTNPFRGRPGAVGKPLRGQEVRLAGDGEILVRGANVMAGYWDDPEATRAALDEDGWLHTGDLGARDDDGQLRIIGRKKEMIVTAEGLNVHPEDVERELRGADGVRDAVVVGRPGPRGEQVHAVLLLAAHASAADVVSEANRSLQPHQRVRDFTVWEAADFPRTPTGKVRRREVAAAARRRPGPEERPAAAGDDLTALLQEVGADLSRAGADARLEDLGLSSLDLVEMAAAVEERYGVAIEDGDLAGTTSVAALRRLAAGESTASSGLEVPLPSWPRRPPARLARALLRDGVILPLIGLWTPLRVEGAGHLEGIDPPALIVANHVSLFDVPVVLRALPRRLRAHTAPAMTADYFRPWLAREGTPARQVVRRLQFFLASLLFEVFLLPRGQGFRDSLRHAGSVADAGGCPLIFPEGRRSVDGLLPFQAGAGLMAARLGLPVIPAHLGGLEKVLPPEARWPRRGRVRVRFGEVLRFGASDDPEAVVGTLEAAIHDLAGSSDGEPSRR